MDRTTPSWNMMRIRAKEFADYWKDAVSEEADKQTFWNEFFEIFGVQRKSYGVYEKAVTRLGRAHGFIDMFWPGTLIVEHKSRGASLEPAFDQAADYAANLSPAEHPRYIIVSDFRYIKLFDLATTGKQSEWVVPLEDLPKKLDLFGFIAGYNKQEYVEQHPIDIKASKQLTKIHDELRKTGYGGQDLEILLVRILFCLFGEDNGVFEKDQFYNYIYERTNEDASDLGAKLSQLFETLNKPVADRQSNLDEHLQGFKYVNGGLFEKHIETPMFDHNMRYSLLDAARNNDWDQINPAIFGAMFQNVMQESGAAKRRELGAHYTSERNILKVIKPLFVDDLRAEFEEIKQDRRLLTEFHNKLANLKFLDPACGCGNFLVVAYRELRRIELDVLKVIYSHLGEVGTEIDLKTIVKCNVDQFYGIEVEEFASQVAQVAMWLTDAQMNNEASDIFHKPLVRLPLTSSATIVHGDALEVDWQEVVKSEDLNYILGNPPFIGQTYQTTRQKAQLARIFSDTKAYGVLDFVACWYKLAVNYIKGTHIRVGFVSTNSITQGEQVSVLWRPLFEDYGLKTYFAHQTFKWTNEASGKAAVYCVIIGFSLHEIKVKSIYTYATPDAEPLKILATNINPYLVDAENVFITNRSKPISNAPSMTNGSKPTDGGNFLLTQEEKDELLEKEPEAAEFIREYISAQEFLHNEHRFCLWLVGADPNKLNKLPIVMDHVSRVREFRRLSKAKTTRDYPYHTLFRQVTQPEADYILVPSTSSENRTYIPMGYISKDVILSNASYAVTNASSYHFGVLESEMHMTWMRYVAGRLKSDYRYSKDIVYNNFPWPEGSPEHQVQIKVAADNIIDVRKKYQNSTLAELYNIMTMPPDLIKAHRELDKAVDKAYRKEPFTSDDERIKYLFDLYKELATPKS